jgi:2-polyprenyl-6-methoxyphenol hydroxylase-like FAD-dependent oxidoreductase
MSSGGRTALIVGGGIGGLAAAVALRRIGWRPLVFERAPEIAEVGAGLGLWANALHALRVLGLADAVTARGSVFERIRTLTPAGRVLGETPVGELARPLGAVSLCVHRTDLQRCLADALDPGCMRTGAPCVGFDQEPDGVTARFADGRCERGALLVGADGIHSRVRARLDGDAPARYAGCTGWRGVARFRHDAVPPGLALSIVGRGAQAGLFHCGAGRMYWYVARNAPPAGDDAVLGAFDVWYPPLREAIAATDAARILKNDIVDRPPLRRWGAGRVTLLGDAAHPTTPNLAQGACQAIEDAVVLAHALRAAPDVATGLRLYERRRRRRTAMVTRQSWRLGRVLHLENRLAVRLRDVAMASRFGRRQAVAVLEAMLGFAVPELPEA